MKVSRLSLLCILVAGLTLAWAGTYEITLQEGVDGYAGTSDAYGRSQSSSSNYGTSQTLNLLYERCSSWSGTVYYRARVAIKFDVSDVEIPSGATVQKAVLSLYSYNRYGTYTSTNNGPKNMYKITESWSESSLTYSKLPSTSSSAIASSNESNLQVWEDFDVTTEMKGVIEDGDQNYGFLLRFSNYSEGVSMRSSEYTNEEYRPKLVLTINDDNAPTVEVKSPAGDIFNPGDDVEIVWEAEDTKGSKAIVQRKIEFSSNNGADWTLIDEANGNTGTFDWTAPTVTSDECLIKVTVTDAGDNEGSDVSEAFEIKPATGIITNNKFNLPMAKEYTVTVLTMQGRELASLKVTSLDQLNTIKLPLSSGMHIMKISTPTQSAIRKFHSIR